MAVAAGVAAGCASPSNWTPGQRAVVDAGTVLDPWFEAVRRADEEAATIVVMGDSVSEGAGLTTPRKRWVDRLQRGLRQRAGTPGCEVGPAGYDGTTSLVPTFYQTESLPSPAVQGRAERALEVGPGGRAMRLAPGGSVTWPVRASGVDVGYRTRSGGGRVAFEVDGERRGSRTTGVDGEGGRAVWSSPDLGPGRHVVTARNVSDEPASVIVTDLIPYRGDRERCVHVFDASRSGVRLATIVRTPGYLADTLSLQPDLLLVPLGFNDIIARTPPAEFRRDLGRLVRESRALGYEGPVLLVGWFTPDLYPWQPAWRDYLDQMQGATRIEGVSFVNLAPVLPPVREAPDGIYYDRLHPSAKGQPLISRALVPALAPRAEDTDAKVTRTETPSAE